MTFVNTEYTELERQVADLRAALGALEVERSNEQILAEVAELRATVGEIRDILVGDNGKGIVDIVTSLGVVVEQLGRLYENAHRDGQLKNEVMDRLVDKLAVEKVALTLVKIYQAILVGQYVAQGGASGPSTA
jgi:hypothetical protein